MIEKSAYDERTAYERLPVYVYPEGDHWVATALGYDHVQRGEGPQLAANRLVRDLWDMGLIARDKQRCVMHKLKGADELRQL